METQMLSARICDTARLCVRSDSPRFLGFLSPEEAALAETLLHRGEVGYGFSGGHDFAERQMLCCFPQWCDDPQYPIAALTFSYRGCDILTHRDFLGALMSLGITRETVGDILTGSGVTVAFLTEEAASFAQSQLTKVGRVGVTVTRGFTPPLPSFGKTESLSSTVASARLDCIIGALCGFSRTASEQCITDGLVSVNSVAVKKPTRIIVNGDRISVRGKGKFSVDSMDDRSKRGRVILRYQKYL